MVLKALYFLQESTRIALRTAAEAVQQSLNLVKVFDGFLETAPLRETTLGGGGITAHATVARVRFFPFFYLKV